MPDEEMGEEGPVLLGDDFHECLFDFDGIVLPGQSHPAGKTTDVGIDDDAFGEVEGVAEDDIGGLSAHSGQLVQVLHGLRHLSAVIPDQSRGATADGFGLGAEEAGGADQAFQLGGGNFGKVLRGTATLK